MIQGASRSRPRWRSLPQVAFQAPGNVDRGIRLLRRFFPAGILSLLEDTSTPELQSFALRKLMSPYDSKTLVGPIAVVDVFWAEIADSIGAMEQVGIGWNSSRGFGLDTFLKWFGIAFSESTNIGGC